MESKAKFAGHPIHQMLIVFPLGLLAASLGFDVGYFVTGNTQFPSVSFWLILAGIIGGLLAAVFGAMDWWAIPTNTRAKAIGLWHGLGNVIVVVLFAISWWIRSNAVGNIPSGAAILASCVAVGLALITGWLGGELVDGSVSASTMVRTWMRRVHSPADQRWTRRGIAQYHYTGQVAHKV